MRRVFELLRTAAVILARGDAIGPNDLPDSVRRPSSPPRLGPLTRPAGYTLDELERLAIQQTLERTGWNKRATADILGIHRPTLYNKMRKQGLWRTGDRIRRSIRDSSRDDDAEDGITSSEP